MIKNIYSTLNIVPSDVIAARFSRHENVSFSRVAFSFQGLDPSEGRPNFWNTLFLIRVDVAYLESELGALSTDQLYVLKVTA